jgi:hypothetical protein
MMKASSSTDATATGIERVLALAEVTGISLGDLEGARRRLVGHGAGASGGHGSPARRSPR